MSRFDPRSYQLFRPLYPQKIFEPLRSYCQPGIKVLDLGAGTGFSTQSFHSFYPSAVFTLVEPDPEMLKAAQTLLSVLQPAPEFVICSAEEYQGGESSYDLILIGSAWHWMKPGKVIPHLKRMLKPGGLLHVFEYQFPKATNNLELNEWIRREFNLRWKAADQTPRGKLRELVEPISAAGFAAVSELHFDHKAMLGANDLCGIIFSQSRYLAYEETLAPDEKLKLREEIYRYLSENFFRQENLTEFFYRMNAYTFKANVTNPY